MTVIDSSRPAVTETPSRAMRGATGPRVAASATKTASSDAPYAAPRIGPAVHRRHVWERRYRRRVAITDTVIVLLSTLLAGVIQLVSARVYFLDAPWQFGRVAVLTAAIWLIMLSLFQTRARRVIGHGSEEYRRVAHATGMAFGILAIGFVIDQSQAIRTQLLVSLPLGIVALLLGRWVARRWLVRQRAAGEFLSKAVVVGARSDVEYVIHAISGDNVAGYHIVGVSLEDNAAANTITIDGVTYPAVGSPDSVHHVAALLEADAVIVASTPSNNADYMKDLSWKLEGTASELVMSSPLADVAGPRMSLRPVEGLPLIQVALPQFEGTPFIVKRAVDIAFSSLALVGVAILTPFIALAIKIDSRGPVLFRQTRVGRDGHTFTMMKFRSMAVDAEKRLAELHAKNEAEGPLFKMQDDPRVTRVGKFLRRTSLDELPQFWNVFIGNMSIVGPRPPLPKETAEYESHTGRRLFIKPGITGPWQVGGRSDLTWDESVRLDLRYVENWSLTEDVLIMARTARAMVKPSGAY